MKRIRLVLAGAGVVGQGFLKLWQTQKAEIEKSYGLSLDLVGIATRTPSKTQAPDGVPVSTDPLKLISDAKPDLVVELIGGTEIAYSIAKAALQSESALITANKALLSKHGQELFQMSETQKLEIGFEAAVAGSIPVIRAFRNGLGASTFLSTAGILNGTTNFILSKMEKEGWDYQEALLEAQKLGFAEADPTFDVEGIDAGHKLSLLASLAFQEKINFESIQIRGISELRSMDIAKAKELGFRIKLIAGSKKTDAGIVSEVSPMLVPVSHPLANVMNEMNAVFYNTVETGPGLLSGKGAGSLPTASAVLSDVIYYGLRYKEANLTVEKNNFAPAKVASVELQKRRYYLRFSTADRPGVLAEIALVLGKNGISIASVQQQETEKEPVHVIVVTHFAPQMNLNLSISQIDANKDIIKEKTLVIPLMEDL